MATDSKIPYEEQKRRGHEIYDAEIRHLICGEDADKHVMIDILSGDYEIGENQATTMRLLRERLRMPLCTIFTAMNPTLGVSAVPDVSAPG